ncbi:hypothetical protein ACIHCV_13645 [Streptomyces sp. NPDC051956]|uniref:hypothetical protein n=1 Tax=Streptomyces sp. NPDC051956 TaxID=3365677 RepID=UPI0037D795F4
MVSSSAACASSTASAVSASRFSGSAAPAFAAVLSAPCRSFLQFLRGLEQPRKGHDDAAEPPALVVVPRLLYAHGHGSRELRLGLGAEEQAGQPARAHEGVTHRRYVVLLPLVFHEHGLPEQVPERNAQDARQLREHVDTGRLPVPSLDLR